MEIIKRKIDQKKDLFDRNYDYKVLEIDNSFPNPEVAPEIKLKACVQNYRPVEAKVYLSGFTYIKCTM